MEAGYARSEEELPASSINHLDEVVLLQDKITFWRRNIPCAEGLRTAAAPGPVNLIALQRQMQLGWAAAAAPPVAPPENLIGDLVGWR